VRRAAGNLGRETDVNSSLEKNALLVMSRSFHLPGEEYDSIRYLKELLRVTRRGFLYFRGCPLRRPLH